MLIVDIMVQDHGHGYIHVDVGVGVFQSLLSKIVTLLFYLPFSCCYNFSFLCLLSYEFINTKTK